MPGTLDDVPVQDSADTTEPPERWLRWAVAAAAVTTGVVVAAVGTLAWMFVSPMLSLFVVPECTEHDRRLTEQLVADPVLTQLRPGLTRTSEGHAAPCERASDTSGIATATVDADPSVTRDAVIAHYRGLLEDGGWTVAADRRAPLLCADRRFDNQQVLFVLHGSDNSTQYQPEIAFLPHRQDLGCS
ncbi:hypothetical protein OHA72_45585 [Dactylosporangium sp. NBC_01737]|uniref:hypothetical protein n=1 Tax=Dactylosporangium sp. NBC_01737 TaxID=2975959 RepID=UPI002E0F339F|nr:hypothetical protein OHA72_45585 [Dactylosporangium sp. NBC_01737]